MVDSVYAENPDDFDTLLLWVLACGNLADPYGEKRWQEPVGYMIINPDHPWVLHRLGKCILGTNPQEALNYAQKVQELDPRYLPLGLEGLCYFQMRDYKILSITQTFISSSSLYLTTSLHKECN